MNDDAYPDERTNRRETDKKWKNVAIPIDLAIMDRCISGRPKCLGVRDQLSRDRCP